MNASRQFSRGFRSIYRRGVLRRAIAAGLLLVFVTVVGGVPLPGLKSTPKSGERFPCEASSCGCDSAERCWQGCCCHTLDQRLEWAKKNGVRPPEFALVEARELGKDTSAWDGSPKSIRLTVAATTMTPSCCSKKSALATRSCCCKKAAATRTCCSSPSKTSSPENEDQGIVAWRALACRGQSLNWLAAVPSLVHVDLQFADQLPLCAWLGPHTSESASGVADVPTPPPPERV
jgi:hypothetical protein